jgi:hypothetical protein
MSNKEIIWPYDEKTVDWLKSRDAPYPPLRPGNRVPTTGEMKNTIESIVGYPLDYPAGNYLDVKDPRSDDMITLDYFDWSDDAAMPGICDAAPRGGFTVRDMCPLLARILVAVCQNCGQLVLMNEGGGTILIFDAHTDPEDITAQYNASWSWSSNSDRTTVIFAG